MFFLTVFDFGFHKIFNFVPKIASETYKSKPVFLLRSEEDLIGKCSISSLYLQYRVQIVLQLTTELWTHLKMRQIYSNKTSDYWFGFLASCSIKERKKIHLDATWIPSHCKQAPHGNSMLLFLLRFSSMAITGSPLLMRFLETKKKKHVSRKPCC